MRGLARGEQSTDTNPVLQLFCRRGQFLVDPVEASFLIEDVRNPDNSPTTKVASTPIDLNDAPTGHKLGTGRFYLPTGGTASWGYGTHRAVCRYKMESAGREYIQVIEFEVLNPNIYTSGQDYVGYAATRDLYLHRFFTIAAVAPDTLHQSINQVAVTLEDILGRFFEPRYVDMRSSGDGRHILFMDEAIIAADVVAQVDVGSDGLETFTPYDHPSFRVMNRHLDGMMRPDDRHNPYLHSIASLQNSVSTSSFLWPGGERNISVTGVFGYTDPSPRPDDVAIGVTPRELGQVTGILISRLIADPTMQSPGTWRPGTVKKYKTRDQMVEFFGANGSVDISRGIMGDPMLSTMLERFVRPARVSYPEHY